MMPRNIKLFFLFIVTSLAASSQDTLPGFSVINKGNDRIIISWTNPYGETVRQLSIQRSADSLKNYKSILTVPDPTTLQNGYVDSKAPTGHMFYRLYILLDAGKYSFSRAKRPAPDTGRIAWTGENKEGITASELEKIKQGLRKQSNERILIVKKNNVLTGAILASSFKNFRDSVTFNTMDTIYMKTADTIVINPFILKEYFTPSRYVFTEKDGNVKISLRDANSRKYSVKFFEEDNTAIFEIKQILEPLVIIDKTNFIHFGWFTFELYEDGKLKEKHKLFIPKD